MDKLTKIFSKVIGEKAPAPPPPPVQHQNSPTVTAQAPTSHSQFPPPGSPISSVSTPPAYGAVSGAAQPTVQEQVFQAVKNGRSDIVKQLLLAHPGGIDIMLVDPGTRMSPLRVALDAKNDELAQLLFVQGKGLVNAGTRGGETPLMMAAMHGLLKTGKSLLRRGAEVNDQDVFRKTALHHACENKTENVQLIQALLDAGADMNLADSMGNTPLSLACRKGHVDAVKLLCEKGAVIQNTRKGNDHAPLL